MALQPQYEPHHITAGIVKRGIEKSLAYRTDLGALYEGDCLDLFPWIESDSVDTVFADPPFNLAKQYGKAVNGESKVTGKDRASWNRENRPAPPAGSRASFTAAPDAVPKSASFAITWSLPVRAAGPSFPFTTVINVSLTRISTLTPA